jgi:hypothetical protein
VFGQVFAVGRSQNEVSSTFPYALSPAQLSHHIIYVVPATHRAEGIEKFGTKFKAQRRILSQSRFFTPAPKAQAASK